MGAVLSFRDRLVNLMTGQGTSNDQRSYGFHVLNRMTPQQIEASYRSSWLMRNAVDIPAYDMTRAWRDWQADGPQIEAIEAEERRLALRDKVRRALVLGRLGGAALVMGVGSNADQPLGDAPAGSLAYLHVMSRHQLNLGPIIRDPADTMFGEPAYFELRSRGATARIHPSRVIAFKGQQVPDMGTASTDDWYWGDPIAQTIQDAVDNADAAQSGFASLIGKARLDIIKMPGLMQNAATAEYEQQFMERMRLAGLGASTHQALVIDGEEDWQQRQVNWAGMPEIIKTYLAIVAGATGIPATRLLGKAPDGMNATGEGDEKNYYTMIAGRQENDLRPLLERVDAVMLASLGISDPDVSFAFAPLSVLSEKERADIAKTKAETTQIYANTGLVPTIALEKGVQNQLVEDETYPGLDGALAELGEDERFPSLEEPEGEDLEEEPEAPPLRRAANDRKRWHDIEGGGRQAEPPFADGKRRRGGHGGHHYVEGEHPRGGHGRWTTKAGTGTSEQESDELGDEIEAFAEWSLANKGQHRLFYLPSPDVDHIRMKTGLDVKGYHRAIGSHEIVKIFNTRGPGKIEEAGQRTIAVADLRKIPRAIAQGDLRLASQKTGRPPSIEFSLRDGSETITYAERIMRTKRRLGLITLYVKSGS